MIFLKGARGVQTAHHGQPVLPSAETAAMLLWALLASGADQHAESRQLEDAIRPQIITPKHTWASPHIVTNQQTVNS
jgi:hypothetical protein